ncbi:hypothetical protein HXX76_010474 [Chlamydomonas incerta]|uniref:Lipid droplet-associated hydrolase n=1 Tax=Chlamydomonas incerta TaxID=51695 RepID=A0A835SMI7_CHLIN|nr:hypothetical protein HXX76_010474 [Chlamydomonas incerta]|eukprot:KAG2428326.1 hypothetical protein HXX76_010474 [Chlamydomonas incerta]
MASDGTNSPANSGVARPWQEFFDVGGVRTELLGIDASPGPARLQVLIVPGNPGFAALYLPLMAHLHAALGGTAAVLAASHAGHDGMHPHGGRQVWDLAEQVAHKAALLRRVAALLPGGPPLVVVAHSIGAAMMLRAIASVEGWAPAGPEGTPDEQGAKPPPAADGTAGGGAGAAVVAVAASGGGGGGGSPAILKLVAVFPFLEAAAPGSNARQAAIRRVAAWHGRLGWLGDLLAALPTALLAGCLRLGSGMAGGPAAAMAARLNRSTLVNSLYLGTDEFKELSRPWPWPQLASGLGARLHVMGCDQDTWLSRAQYEEMRQRVPGLQATWHADLRHDFCVHDVQCRAVAVHVARIVAGAELMPGGGREGAELPPGGGRAGAGQGAAAAAAVEAAVEGKAVEGKAVEGKAVEEAVEEAVKEEDVVVVVEGMAPVPAEALCRL